MNAEREIEKITFEMLNINFIWMKNIIFLNIILSPSFCAIITVWLVFKRQFIYFFPQLNNTEIILKVADLLKQNNETKIMHLILLYSYLFQLICPPVSSL